MGGIGQQFKDAGVSLLKVLSQTVKLANIRLKEIETRSFFCKFVWVFRSHVLLYTPENYSLQETVSFNVLIASLAFRLPTLQSLR